MPKYFNYIKSKATICEFIILIYLFTLFVQSPFPPYRNYYHDKQHSIYSDGFGYYSYLPAIFIYQDLGFNFFDSVHLKNYHYEPTTWTKSFITEINKCNVNKYWIGVSLLLLPFFLIAHWLSLLFGIDADGYSILYQYAVFAASFFYLYLGCRFLRLFLLKKHFSEKITALSIFTIVFGTNLFYYSMYEPSMSHIYSFFAISGFCYFTSEYFKSSSFRNLFISLFFIIIVLLVRPVNIIVLSFIPFLAENYVALKKGGASLLSHGFKTFYLLILLVGPFIQMFIWHNQCGNWLVWSYPNENFNFNNPHFIEILFSYRKGFFVYMPLLFVSLIGLIYVFKKNLFQFFSIVLSFTFITYVLSSWYAWDYSACLGNRAFIDFYFLFSYLIAVSFVLFQQRWQQIVMFCVFFVLIIFNHIQIFQYKHFIYHSTDMDKEKYWKVFAQTGRSYEGIFYDWSDYTDRKQLLNKYTRPVISFENKFESENKFWTNYHVEKKKFAYSGKYVTAVNDNSVFSDAAILPDSIFIVKNNLLLDVHIKTYLHNELARGYLVIQIIHNGGTKFWKQIKISDANSGVKRWSDIYFCQELPGLEKGDEIRVFVQCQGASSLYLDDCALQFYTF